MNSKSASAAIMSRLKSKAKNPKNEPRLTRDAAADAIAEALHIRYEAAMMILYGLCATGKVRCFDDQGEVIEDCMISEFEGKASFVIAEDVHHWLLEFSSRPQPQRRDAEIEKRLRGGAIPGRNISWKEFCNDVRDACNAYDTKHRPISGFGDKQIQRVVKDLKRL